jgi:hypothetical protein
MIDLDTLLHENPTWEEVVEFWKDDGEFCGEQYLVAAIERWLQTEEQRKGLFDHRLSIEKMLNGRYVSSDVGDFVESLFTAWNEKLGFEAFNG